jgi:hypothetical protein
MQPLEVERRRAEEPYLLLRCEQKLDASVRAALGEHTAGTFEHGGDRRLVVRTENRPGAVPDHALLDHRLDRSFRGNRVEMRAEKDGTAAVGGLDPAVDVADVRADLRPGVVFVHRQAEIAEIPDHDVGDRTFVARRARQRSKLGEKVDYLGGHALDPM